MRRSDGKKTRPLTAEHARDVAKKIDGWPVSKRITWNDVVNLAAVGKGRDRYEWGRVTLDRNPYIKDAYEKKAAEIRKAAAGKPVRRPKSSGLEDLERKIEVLEKKLESQNCELMDYDRKFVTWLYNATLHGMTEDTLNAPITPPERGQTDRDELAAARAKKECRNERAR